MSFEKIPHRVKNASGGQYVCTEVSRLCDKHTSIILSPILPSKLWANTIYCP